MRGRVCACKHWPIALGHFFNVLSHFTSSDIKTAYSNNVVYVNFYVCVCGVDVLYAAIGDYTKWNKASVPLDVFICSFQQAQLLHRNVPLCYHAAFFSRTRITIWEKTFLHYFYFALLKSATSIFVSLIL